MHRPDLTTALASMCALLVIASCASDATTTVPTSPAASKPTNPRPKPTTPTDPIAAQIHAGGYPPCKLVVGEPTSVVVKGVSAKGVVDLHCITGSTTTADMTGAAQTHCDIVNETGQPIYYWGSQDPANVDQNLYAAKASGVVVVVPSQTAHEFFTFPGGLASVLLAVGRC